MSRVMKDMDMIIGKYLHDLEVAALFGAYTRKEVHDYIRSRCGRWNADDDIKHYNVNWIDGYIVFLEYLDAIGNYHTINHAFDMFKSGRAAAAAAVTVADPITDYDRAMQGI